MSLQEHDLIYILEISLATSAAISLTAWYGRWIREKTGRDLPLWVAFLEIFLATLVVYLVVRWILRRIFPREQW